MDDDVCPDPTCSTPWIAFIVLISFIALVAIWYFVEACVQLARRQKQSRSWKQWLHHRKSVAGPMREEGEAMVHRLQNTVVGGKGTVTMGGSVSTGAVQPTSDIDIKIVANSCQDYADVAAALEADPAFTHVHSGGKFALFSTTTPRGVPVDVSLEVEGNQPMTSVAANQLAEEREARGYLEYLIRRAHPNMTIRRDKTYA